MLQRGVFALICNKRASLYLFMPVDSCMSFCLKLVVILDRPLFALHTPIISSAIKFIKMCKFGLKERAMNLDKLCKNLCSQLSCSCNRSNIPL